MIGNDKKGDFMNDITQGYQPLPKDELGFDVTIHEEANEDCIACWGDGEVQCCAGEHYYTDDCDCVMIQYWEGKGNEFMVDGHRKMLANTLKWRNI